MFIFLAIKQAHTLFYRPFEPLAGSSNDVPPYIQRISQIENHIRTGDWDTARQKSSDLIKLGLTGLHYLQTYQRTLIRAIVVTAYIGWSAFASLFVFRPLDGALEAPGKRTAVDVLALLVLASFWTLFLVQREPWTYFLYIAFPCYFWHQFFSHATLSHLLFISSWPTKGFSSLLRGVAVTISLWAMVAAYTHRSIWSVGYILIGVFWPAIFWPKDLRSNLGPSAYLWPGLCLLSAIFPLLEVNKSESLLTMQVDFFVLYHWVTWNCLQSRWWNFHAHSWVSGPQHPVSKQEN